MKCIICPSEIDEAKVVPTIEGPSGRPIEDIAGKMKLARELEKWTCASITAQVPGGCKTIRSGHLCPAHNVDNLNFSLDIPIIATVAAPSTASPKGASTPTSQPQTESKGK
jgi:hypothetical protein